MPTIGTPQSRVSWPGEQDDQTRAFPVKNKALIKLWVLATRPGGGPASNVSVVKHDRQLQVRDMLVVMLTVTTGAVDAVSVLHLIGVFSSVITGNIVLFGVAAGV